MLKKYFKGKIRLVEGCVIIFSLIWFFINQSLNQQTGSELIVNLTFLTLLATLVIARDSSLRHMYFGFILLVLTMTGNIAGYDQFVYMVSSLTLSLFILGLINMLTTKNEYQNSQN